MCPSSLKRHSVFYRYSTDRIKAQQLENMQARYLNVRQKNFGPIYFPWSFMTTTAVQYSKALRSEHVLDIQPTEQDWC